MKNYWIIVLMMLFTYEYAKHLAVKQTATKKKTQKRRLVTKMKSYIIKKADFNSKSAFIFFRSLKLRESY